MTQQEKVEEILKDNPCMARNDLLRLYLSLHTNYTTEEIELFLLVLDDVNVMNVLRYARKYRQKLGIRDEVREKMAEQERRYYPEQPNLEPNPPKIPQNNEIKQPLFII